MNTQRTSRSPSRPTERGSATIVMIGLLTILIILVTANGRIVLNLQRELKLIERQQIERANAHNGHLTNTVDTSTNANHKSP